MNPEPTPTLGATGGDTAWEPLNYCPWLLRTSVGNTEDKQHWYHMSLAMPEMDHDFIARSLGKDDNL